MGYFPASRTRVIGAEVVCPEANVARAASSGRSFEIHEVYAQRNDPYEDEGRDTAWRSAAGFGVFHAGSGRRLQTYLTVRFRPCRKQIGTAGTSSSCSLS